MKRSGILNAALSQALAEMGHGDGLLVVDAGFPIPRGAWRIDLAIRRDLPDLRTVLDLIAGELIVEDILVAEELRTNNAPLHGWIELRWPAVGIRTTPHAELSTTTASAAKAVVRTGAFEPFGNVLLTSGVDVPQWFNREGVVVPDHYRSRMGLPQGIAEPTSQRDH